MTSHSLTHEQVQCEAGAVDAQMRAYLRAFATVVVPGSMVSLALCVTALSAVLT